MKHLSIFLICSLLASCSTHKQVAQETSCTARDSVSVLCQTHDTATVLQHEALVLENPVLTVERPDSSRITFSASRAYRISVKEIAAATNTVLQRDSVNRKTTHAKFSEKQTRANRYLIFLIPFILILIYVYFARK